MNNTLIQQAQFIHQLIEKENSLNKSRIQSLWQLMEKVSSSFDTAGTSMLNTRNQFTKIMEPDTTENDCLRGLIQYMQDILKTLGRLIQGMGKDIKSLLVDPLQHFFYDFQISSKKCTEFSLDIMDQIQENLSRLNKIEKAFKEKKNILVRKTSMFKSEENKYRGDMISTNDVWAGIQYRYSKLLQDFDVANEQRCEFLKRSTAEFMKILNRLPQSEQMEYKVKEYEQLGYIHFETEEAFVLSVQKQFGRSQLLRPLKMFNSMKIRFQEDRELLMKLKEIENFSETYLVKLTSEVSLKTRTLILETLQNSQYFLCCICCKLHTQKTLPTDKYNDLLTLIKYIFAESMQTADNSRVLYGILYLSIRIVNQGVAMIKQFTKYSDYWENAERWDIIFTNLTDHLSREHFHTKKSTTKLLHRSSSMMNRKRISSKSTPEQQFSKKYQALREINVLITQLQLDSSFAIRYIVKRSKQLNLTKHQTESLLMYQEQTKKNNLKTMYFSYKATCERKTVQLQKASKLGIIYAIKKSLRYLDVTKDKIFRLRLVCRKWSEQLRQSIITRCLFESNLNIIEKMRVRLYQAFIPQAYTSSLYKKMLAEVPEDFPLLQQIDIDVKRSMNSRPQLRQTLKNMLVVFSYYNEKIGYLQGMNYIGEGILKLNMTPHASYCMLEFMLRKFFSSLFSGNLDNLKVKLYQFMRLMERYLPNLYKHLENQKIESQHFLVAWVVTIWGEMEGDIVWIMWDGFLIDGWKWWAKVCLWLLKIFQADLLQMNFQQILKFFSDLPSNAFFKCKFNDYFVYAISPLKIKDEINQFKVTKKMLDLLQSEYLYSQKKYKQIMMTE